MENTKNIIDSIKELNTIQDPHWMEHTLFTWQWWVGVVLTLLPWILWIAFRKKNSSNRLLFVGIFVMIFTSYLDFLGVEFGLWYYEYKVIPTIPAYMPWDSSLFPVTIMFLLQYKPKLSPIIKAICFSMFSAFIAEPFFAKIELYHPILWKSIYSFPIYLLFYLICHALSKVENFESL